MPAKPKISLETSVVGAYFDFKQQDDERKAVTQKFWSEILSEYNSYISETVIAELVKEIEHADQQIQLVKNFESLTITKEIDQLAYDYLEFGVIRPTKLADALHLAVSTINKIEYLVSWNYRDLARPTQQRKITDYNESHKLYVPTITTPDDFFEK